MKRCRTQILKRNIVKRKIKLGLANIFTKDVEVIKQAFHYLRAYAIDTFITAILFCYIGYYNGCGKTLFVMIQGLVGAFFVRVPVVLLMSNLSNTTLFHNPQRRTGCVSWHSEYKSTDTLTCLIVRLLCYRQSA